VTNFIGPCDEGQRVAYELVIPDLRCWPLPHFPYLLMYVERDAAIDVWRVLHTRRDIPSTLADANEQPRRG
jgi:toxin ParE1/3/4